jgi:hypothetical protein
MRHCLQAAAAVRLAPEVLHQQAGPAIAQLIRAARIEAIGAAAAQAKCQTISAATSSR